MSYDNVGNVTFWRSALTPDASLVGDADRLLNRVRSDIDPDAHVGDEIEAPLALTWIGERSDTLNDEDRKVFDQLRGALGYWLPLGPKFAPMVDELVDQFIAVVPSTPFTNIALARITRPDEPLSTEVAARAEPSDPERVETLIADGLSAGRDGDHERARVLFAEALELNPESGEVHAYLGQALVALKEPRLALEHLYAALAIEMPLGDIRDSLIQAHFNIGADAFSRHEDETAAASYRRVLELDPADVEARRHLAMALVRSGRVEQALLEAARLDRDHVNDAGVNLDVGIVLLKAGQVQDALAKFKRAKQLRPGWTWALVQQATALFRMDSPVQAEAALRAALETDPDFIPALDMLARELRRTGREREAEQVSSHMREVRGPAA